MLSHLSRAKKRLLTFTFSLFVLVLILLNTYEILATKVANFYLQPYNSHIEALRISPRSFHHWTAENLELSVHDSHIVITDLDLVLDDSFSLFSLLSQPISADYIAQTIHRISLQSIDVQLNPSVLTNEGKNLDEQGPTLALDVLHLPQIEIGRTSMSLTGVPAEALSLTLDHLSLDSAGHLSTSISRNTEIIFTLDAQISERQWQVSSLLVFDEFQQLLTDLVAQELDNSALSPLLTLKQNIEQAGVTLNGALHSSATLNLKTAQLNSTHKLIDADLILSRFNDLIISPITHGKARAALDNAHSVLNSPAEPDKYFSFDISGHLSTLELSVLPFSLNIAPTMKQLDSLFVRLDNTTVSPLISALLASKPRQALTDKPKANIGLSLDVDEPLHYSFSSHELKTQQANLELNHAQINASLSLKHFTLAFATHEQAFQLTTDWQLAASREHALLLNDLIPDAQHIVIDQQGFDVKFGGSSVALSGDVAIGEDESFQSTVGDSTQNMSLKLNVNSGYNAYLSSVELLPLPTEVNGLNKSNIKGLNKGINKDVNKGINPKQGNNEFSRSPIAFNIQDIEIKSEKPLSLTSNKTNSLAIALPPLHISVGPTYYQQDINSASDLNTLSLTAQGLSVSTLGSSQLLLPSPEHLNTEASLLLSRFALSANDVMFNHVNSKGDNLTLSTLETDFTSLGVTELIHATHSDTGSGSGSGSGSVNNNQHTDHIQLTIPPLHYEQVGNEFTLSSSASIDKSEYLATLSTMSLSLKKPSNLRFSVSPQFIKHQLLSQNEWHNSLDYQLQGMDVTRHYIKNNRKRSKTLLEIDNASLSQTLDWDNVSLNTQESWLFEDAEFDAVVVNSKHQLTPEFSTNINAVNNLFQLTGELELASDFKDILGVIGTEDILPEALIITGKTQLKTQYQLHQAPESMILNVDLSPELSSLSGSMNDLPFEDADISANCHYQLIQKHKKIQDNNKSALLNTSTLSCPDIKLAVAAFNPGVLLTDLTTQADFSVSHDDNLIANKSAIIAGSQLKMATQNNNKATIAAIPATLSAANIQLKASGSLLGGQLFLPEFNLRLHDKSHGYLVLQGLELEQLLAIQPQVGLYADGIFDGVLPVDLIKGKVSVRGGRLAARPPGGLISVSGNPAVEQMRLSQPYLDFAFSTMEHLEYSELASTFDMQPTGDAVLKVNVKGTTKGIERPIHLNYSQEENMLQLLKSLQIGDKLQTQIEQSMN